MSTGRRTRANSIHSLILLAALAAIPGVEFVQGASAGMPENARAKSYGSGWECNRGYRRADRACAAIIVPSNAYLGPSGDRWECDRGYSKIDEACVAVKVPPHGYLADTSYGSG